MIRISFSYLIHSIRKIRWQYHFLLSIRRFLTVVFHSAKGDAYLPNNAKASGTGSAVSQ